MLINKNNLNNITSQHEIYFLDKYINNLSQCTRSVGNYLIGMSNSCAEVTISQRAMARKLGYNKETINKATSKLSAIGLIKKIDRGIRPGASRRKLTCLYKVAPYLEHPEIRRRYADKFKSLYFKKTINSLDSIQYENFTPLYSENLLQKEVPYGNKNIFFLSSFINKNIYINNKEIIQKLYNSNDILYCKRNKNPKKETYMNGYIKDLGGFNEAAKEVLSAYPLEAVKHSIKQIGKKTGLKGNAFPYFKAILEKWCKDNNKEADWATLEDITGNPVLTLPIKSSSLFEKPNTVNEKITEEIKRKSDLPVPPVAFWHLSTDNNIERLKKYYESATVKAYMEDNGEKGQKIIANVCSKFNDVLKTHTKENIIRWYKNCFSLFGDIETMHIARENHPFLEEISLIEVAPAKNNLFGSMLNNIKKDIPQSTPKNEPKSIIINEIEFEEVLD